MASDRTTRRYGEERNLRRSVFYGFRCCLLENGIGEEANRQCLTSCNREAFSPKFRTMRILFDPADRDSLLLRLSELQGNSPREWGKMNAPQMLTHCSIALETAVGDRPMKHKLIGKLLAPFVRASVFGEKLLSRNSPTDPTFVVRDERNFEAERQRLLILVDRFCKLGPVAAGKQIHNFFGKLSGEEWGQLQYKHLDHHFRQFGA